MCVCVCVCVCVRGRADKCCLYCNIFSYIRHIWTKPVTCSRMCLSAIILHLEHTDSQKFVPDGYRALLQQVNAIAITRDAIQRLDFSTLPHPPYSPDLAPSDFHVFANLKENMKGQRFTCDEEVKSAVSRCFQKQNTNFFLRTDFKN